MSTVIDLPRPAPLPSYTDLIEQGYTPSDVRSAVADLPVQEAATLFYDWRFWARPGQTPPEWDWRVWVLTGGRGSGKSWTGANWINDKALTVERLALIGRTAADIRDVMVQGDSGVIRQSPPWFQPVYEPSRRRVTWPNGAFALCFSADEPNLLRGPQFEVAWADELAAWRKLEETWNNLMFCLRIGEQPQVVVTTTPRPLKTLKNIIALPSTHRTNESTYANIINLADNWAEEVISQYEGTRLGRQELHGEILDDNPNALWTREMIDDNRVTRAPDLNAVTVAVDPPASDNPTEKTAECGIVVGGRAGKKSDRKSQCYILDDLSLGRVRPEEWGGQVVAAYYKYKADKVVAEQNNGGAMVRSTIQAVDPKVKVELVSASRGKMTRAEPVSALYERHRVHHVGHFPEMEDQQCEWEPGAPSPDRMDALVWLVTDLMLGELPIERIFRSAAS
jgi:phage terminase large subunit-like protein